MKTFFTKVWPYQAVIYLFKVNNGSTITTWEISSNLTINAAKRCLWRRSNVFNVNLNVKDFTYCSIVCFHCRIWTSKCQLGTKLLKAKTWNSPANIHLFKANNRNTINRCEIISKLIIKTPKWRHSQRFGIFIVNFENISHLF